MGDQIPIHCIFQEILNKIIKVYYFHTLKALWDGQGKIKMYYGMFRIKKTAIGKKVY